MKIPALATPPVANPPAQHAARILLVEDDSDMATMYRFKLESDGFSVHLADAGETVLTLAFHRPPDLALLDIGLPDMDGLQVLAALRADARTLAMPVVILSSCDDPDVIRRGFELGATEYLVKTEATPAQVSDCVALWTTAQGTLQGGCIRGCIPSDAAQGWAVEVIQWKAPIFLGRPR
jgi:CheY-like chemotaxis protein